MSQSGPSFPELMKGATRSAVHLEMRDVYAVRDEAEDFARWQRTGQRDVDPASDYWKPWVELVGDALSRGIVMRRARIVSEPVTEYIRYEHAGTPVNLGAGELVRWLPRRQASDIALPGNDFWLIDERIVRWGHFTGDGDFVDQEVTDDPDAAVLCARAFEAVWERGIPHEKFNV